MSIYWSFIIILSIVNASVSGITDNIEVCAVAVAAYVLHIMWCGRFQCEYCFADGGHPCARTVFSHLYNNAFCAHYNVCYVCAVRTVYSIQWPAIHPVTFALESIHFQWKNSQLTAHKYF